MTIVVQHIGGATGTSSGAIAAPSWTSVAGSTIVVLVNMYDANVTLLGSHVHDNKSNTYTLRANLNGGSGQTGVGVWENEAGTRGASHVVTFDPGVGTFPVIAVAEITADGRLLYDSTTAATSTDAASPFDVTAAAALLGHQIGFYASAPDTGNDNAWGNPKDYTPVYTEAAGSAGGLIYAGYRIGETGTPTVGATKGGSIAANRNVFVSFQEVPRIVNLGYNLGSTSITKPSGGQPGDFYVVGVYTENGTTFGLSGFTAVGADSTANDPSGGGIQGRVNTFWRLYDGTEGSTFAPSGLGSYEHLVTFIVRGADPAQTPVYNAVANSATSPYNVPGVTTVAPNSLALIHYSGVATDAFSASVSGWTTELDQDAHTLGLFSKMFAAAGATGTAALTFDNGGGSQAHAGMIAFAPRGPLYRTIRDSKAGTGSNTTGITSNSFTPSNNSLLVVMGNLQQDISDISAADLTISDTAGLSWTKQVSRLGAGNFYSPCAAIWTAPVTTGVSMTVTVDTPGSAGLLSQQIVIVDYTGYDSVGVTAAEAIADDGADSATLSGTPIANSVIFGGRAAGVDASGTSHAVEGSGYIEIADLSVDDASGLQVQERPAGLTSTAFSWTDIANGTAAGYDSIGLAIEIKQAVVSAPPADVLGSPVIDVARHRVVTHSRVFRHVQWVQRYTSTVGGPATYGQSTDGTITTAGVLLKQDNKNLAGPLTPVGLVPKQDNKNLAGGMTPAGTLTRVVVHAVAVSGTLTPAGTLSGTLTFKALAGFMTPSGTLHEVRPGSTIIFSEITKQANKNPAGGLTPAGALTADFISGAVPAVQPSPVIGIARERVALTRPFRYVQYSQRNYYDSPKFIDQQLAGSITPAGTLTKLVLRNVAGSIDSVGTIAKQTNKPLAGVLTSAGTIVKQSNKALAGVLNPAGVIAKQANKPLVGFLTPAGTIAKQQSKAFAGALIPGGVVAKQDNKVTSGGFTPTGEVDALTVEPFTGTIAPAGALTKQVNKNLAGGLTPTGTPGQVFISGSAGLVQPSPVIGIARERVTLIRPYRYAQYSQRSYYDSPKLIDVQLSGSLTPTGAVAKQVNKPLVAGITPVGTVAKQTSKTFAGGLTPAGVVAKQDNKALAGGIISTGAISRSVNKPLSGLLTPAGTIAKQVNKIFVATITSNGTLTRVAVHTLTLTGSLTPTGALTKQDNKVTSGGLTPTGEVDASTVEPLTGTIIPAAAITKLVAKAFAGSVGPTGNLVAEFVSGVQDVQSRNRWMAVSGRRPHLHASFSHQRKPVMGGVSSYAVATDGTIVPAAALVKQTNKNLAGQLLATGDLQANPVYQLNRGQNRVQQQYNSAIRKPSKAIWYQKQSYQSLPSVYQVALTATITPTAVHLKQTNKPLAGAIVPSGALAKNANKRFTGLITSSGLLTKAGVKALTATIGSSGVGTKQTRKSTAGALLPVGNAPKFVTHVLAGLCTTSGVPTKQTLKALTAVIPESGHLETLKILYTATPPTAFEPIWGVLVSSGRTTSVVVSGLVVGELTASTVSGRLVESERVGELVGHATSGRLRNG